jgi:hypothetical protein
MTECAEGLTPTPMHVLLSIIVVDTRREKIEIMTCYKYINSLFLVATTTQLTFRRSPKMLLVSVISATGTE